MARKRNGTKIGCPFVPMLSHVMDSPAWLALSPWAKALHPRLKRFAGPMNNAFLSVRDAAAYLQVHKDTASKAFRELQAHGFIKPVQIGSLGVAGEGKATSWRMTELGTPDNPIPTKEFLRWRPGQDFPVEKGRSPARKKQKPVLPDRTFAHKTSYQTGQPVLPDRTACPTRPDVLAKNGTEPVPPRRTHLDKPSPWGLRRFAVVQGGAVVRVGVRSVRGRPC